MKDSTKDAIRAILRQVAAEIPNGRESSGIINLTTVLTAINQIAADVYSNQRYDSEAIGSVVESIRGKYPTLGKASLAAMATKEIVGDSNDPLLFPATLRKVTAFVEETYTTKRGKVVVNAGIVSK